MTYSGPVGVPALMSLVQVSAPLVELASWWREVVGASYVATLRRLGVLLDAGLATHYPCGDPAMSGCMRRVHFDPLGPERSYLVVCGHRSGSCDITRVREEDLQLLRLCLDDFIIQLRRCLALGGPIESPAPGEVTPQHIGQFEGTPVYLARAPALLLLDAWASCRNDALILVPTARAVTSATRDRYAPGHAVEVVVLEEALKLQDDGFALKRPLRSRGPAATIAVVQPAATAIAICEVFAQDGRRKLSRSDYLALCSRREDYHLFLDQTDSSEGLRHPGWRRALRGQGKAVALTCSETDAIVELVRAASPMRQGDFRKLSVTAIDRLVERARKKLDVHIGRRKWRSIHTSQECGVKAWHFAPPAELRWAVICRLST